MAPRKAHGGRDHDHPTSDAARMHGSDDYLAKPLPIDELLEPMLGPARTPDRSTLMVMLLPIAVRIDELWRDAVEAGDEVLSLHLLDAKHCLNRALAVAQPRVTPLVPLAVQPVVPAPVADSDWAARMASTLRHPSSHSVPTERHRLRLVSDDRPRAD
jgi:hypothetical protein